MGFTVDGIASGLPTDTIISQMLSLERLPIQKLESRKNDFAVRLNAVQELNTRVASLRGLAESLDGAFDLKSVDVSDSDVLSVSASTTAAAGSYEIEVEQLATAQKRVAQGVADADLTSVFAGDGEFSFRIGDDGETETLELDAGATVRDLANKINAAKAGISASIISDGSENGDRLVLSATDTGRAGEFTILTNDSSLDFANKRIDSAEVLEGNSGTYTGTATSSGTYTGTGNGSYLVDIVSGGVAGVATYRFSTDGGQTWDDNGGGGYATTTAASLIGNNAEGVEIAFSDDGSSLSVGDTFQVDVFDPNLRESQEAVAIVDGIRVTSSSNTLSEVVDGLTISLLQADPGSTVQVDVTTDTAAAYQKVSDFVSGYNALAAFSAGQSAYNEDSKTAGPLSGDSTLRTVMQSFRNIMGSSVPGVASGWDTLGALGVKASQEGLFSVDQATFAEKLAEDPEAVKRVVLGLVESSTSQIRYVSRSQAIEAGSYDLTIEGVGEDRKVYLNGEELTVSEDSVSGAEGGDFEGLVLEIQDLADQDEGLLGQITVSEGVADRIGVLAKDMVDGVSGILAKKTEAIQRSIDDATERITRATERLSTVEARLRKKFSNLEVSLGKMNSQGSYLSSQLASLSATTSS